ncbi:MAG: sensor histidine kinase [Gemmatimonadales bacterium]|nr:MAG: sensor histidine kinase [Gemmatimonadales bacterium]
MITPAGKTPSLRFRLLGGLLILLFLALFTVAVTVYIGLQLELPAQILGVIVAAVIVADILFTYVVADRQLSRSVLKPVEGMVLGSERIASGDEGHRLVGSDTAELDRLAAAVNTMAESLIQNQVELARNVESLDVTNQALSDAHMSLVRSEKLASIGRLSAGVAHEVGNPLGAILGYAALGQKDDAAEPEWLQGIVYEAHRIDRIVRGLLDYARPKAASTSNVEINEVATRTVQMMTLQGRFNEVDVETDLAERLPRVLADAHQLEQVLVNLLLNASDAIQETGRRGTIRITTRMATAGELLADADRRRTSDPHGIDYTHLRRFEGALDPGPQRSLQPGDAAVEVAVTDDGTGLSDEALARLFEPFFTTKEPGRGTGLGLAVSARLIEGMGGTIEVESGVETGASFRLLLPPGS